MRIASILTSDPINSITGYTLTFYIVGCDINCKNCYNKQLQDYSYGKEYNLDEIKNIINLSEHTNISFLGGDCFNPKERYNTIELIKWIKLNTKNIIYVWTGYSFEYVSKLLDVSLIDILITDPFDVSLQNLKLLLRGSSNQRLYFRGKQVTEKELLEKVENL